MKIIITAFIVIISLLVSSAPGQSSFSAEAYADYLNNNQNLTYEDLQSRFVPEQTYYKGFSSPTLFDDFCYYDSLNGEYKLTNNEKELLQQNRFVVTERLNYDCFGKAYHDIYVKDLPVFVSTDAILHALHASYDQILIDLELSILKPNLVAILDTLYISYPELLDKYVHSEKLQDALKDVDLYITIAKSLLTGELISSQYADQQSIDDMWNAIQNEQLVSLPLFSTRPRKLDFSQFTVRGHYNTERLRDYFKAMMWLGRMDFFLTPPPANPFEEPWSREEIRRMNLGAFLLNELIDCCDAHSTMNQNNHIIDFLVGESDNITPTELSDVISGQGLINAQDLLDDTQYDEYLNALKSSTGAEQKILSQFMMMDPFSSEPGELPVSYRIMGQRFIVDSYIFFNVVFDRVVFGGKKVWRPLPDPLDALFVLGNDNALPLLKDELEKYTYGSQLAALRYLVEAYDEEFWDSSLYNVWLGAIRTLNPSADTDNLPVFMKTAAWHQNKINTQLASWSQLRHDNLLYAKQSYTGATGCLYPHSFIEPVPEFYAQISNFAQTAEIYFSQFEANTWEMHMIREYFPQLRETMNKLELLASKELAGQPFSNEERKWLKEMLFLGGASGEPPFTGWYSHLYYHPDDAAISNYIIADVHTQPTDQAGNVVGNVLHVGTAKINLGVFLVEESSSAGKPVAYIGPVMSYYEHITSNFDRFTDQRWSDMVEAGNMPKRPDWVNIYLADKEGNRFDLGRELPSEIYTSTEKDPDPVLNAYKLYQNYPNPFNPSTTIRYNLAEPNHVNIVVYNVLGEKIQTLVDKRQAGGVHEVAFNAAQLPSGIYFCQIHAGDFRQTIKLMLVE